MVGVKCSCGCRTIRKFCSNCGKEQEGDYFKCAWCGEKTLEKYYAEHDNRLCLSCGELGGEEK